MSGKQRLAQFYCSESKKDTKLLFMSPSNIDRFLKFFYCYTQQEICNKKIITDATTPKSYRYTTLHMNLL